MIKNNPLGFVLGGGQGARLEPLTISHSKPSLPFLGSYRVIDFILSNLYNSHFGHVHVLTQYQSGSLQRHINRGWDQNWGSGHRSSITVSPATMTKEGGWFKGTADAIYQHSDLIKTKRPSEVNVFGGDHIYLMDVRQFNDFHRQTDADMTISAIPVKRDLAAGNYGVLIVDKEGKVIGFEEKPENPTPIPGNEEYCLTSMGNYVFNSKSLLEELVINASKEQGNKTQVLENPAKYTTNDFGYDVIPAMIREGRQVYAYDFSGNEVPGAKEEEKGFWRDIGNLDQFYEANMEFNGAIPPINLYNEDWPVLSNVNTSFQPVKTINCQDKGTINNQSPGSVISNSLTLNSIFGYDARVESSHIENSILMGKIMVEPGCVIKNAIIDREVYVPENTSIGVNYEEDIARGLTVSPEGIVAVPSGFKF